jgi:hypothetical protein
MRSIWRSPSDLVFRLFQVFRDYGIVKQLPSFVEDAAVGLPIGHLPITSQSELTPRPAAPIRCG